MGILVHSLAEIFSFSSLVLRPFIHFHPLTADFSRSYIYLWLVSFQKLIENSDCTGLRLFSLKKQQLTLNRNDGTLKDDEDLSSSSVDWKCSPLHLFALTIG